MLAAVLRGGEASLHTSLRSWRAISSLANNGSYQILQSPPLLSLDMLDDWTHSLDQDHQEKVSIPDQCKNLYNCFLVFNFEIDCELQLLICYIVLILINVPNVTVKVMMFFNLLLFMGPLT